MKAIDGLFSSRRPIDGVVGHEIGVGEGQYKYQTQYQTTHKQDGLLVGKRQVVLQPSEKLFSCAAYC